MKISKRLVCLAMALALAFALCACASNEESVADFVEENAGRIAKEYDSASAVLDFGVKAEGTAIVVEAKFKGELPEGVDAASLQEYLESEEIALELKSNLEKEKREEDAVSAYIMRYFDKDGNLLAEGKAE